MDSTSVQTDTHAVQADNQAVQADNHAVTADQDAAADASDMGITADEEELSRRRAEVETRYNEVYLKIADLEFANGHRCQSPCAQHGASGRSRPFEGDRPLAEVQLKAADGAEDALTLENDASQVHMTEEALRRTVAANNRVLLVSYRKSSLTVCACWPSSAVYNWPRIRRSPRSERPPAICGNGSSNSSGK